MRTKNLDILILITIVGLFVGAAGASDLFLVEGTAGELRIVDQSTATNALIGSLGTGPSVGGLTQRGGDTAFVYGVHSTIGNEGSRLLKINTATGNTTPLPWFSETVLGFSQPFAQAVAISPTSPDVAIVAGFDGVYPGPTFGNDYIWRVDVNTGAVLGAATPTAQLRALTYSLDGATLYGTDGSGQLVTVDPGTGGITVLGDPGLSTYLQGLAFRPEDGTLFAINAFHTDELVTLDPTDGSLVSVVGPLGVVGPDGLAFVIPEPATLTLLGIGAVGVLLRRRRR